MKKNIFYLTLLLFFIFIFSIFYIGLNKSSFYKPQNVKNDIIEEFNTYELFSNKKYNSINIISNSEFTLINIWSSWCAPCRSEHSKLVELSMKTKINIIGLNYKDKKKNAINFLNELGNPFSKTLIDPDGIISISLGAFGVPETFLLNNNSKVIRKYIGPLTNENVLEIIKITKL